MDDQMGISCAVISKKPVPVVDADPVYERILQYEQQGMLLINRFETLTEEQKARDKRMIMREINRLELLKGTHPLSGFVRETFPVVWEEALRAL